MRKFLCFLALVLAACSSGSDDQSDFSAGYGIVRYYTITNGDSTHSLNVGTGVLEPGGVSSPFTLYGDTATVKCWWLIDGGESIYSPLRVDMKGKPNNTTENYIMRYEHTDN